MCGHTPCCPGCKSRASGEKLIRYVTTRRHLRGHLRTWPHVETQQDRNQERAPAEDLGGLGQVRNPNLIKVETGRGLLFDILKVLLPSSLLNSNGSFLPFRHPWQRSHPQTRLEGRRYEGWRTHHQLPLSQPRGVQTR